MMKTKAISLLSTTMLVFIVCLFSACAKKSDEPVRISIHVWPGYDTIVMARDKQFLNDPNVKLVEMPSASDSIRAFQNRSVDGAFLTIDEVLRLVDNGHDPRIILVMDFSNGADAVLASPDIKNIEALKGRTVGVEPNALGAYMLSRALDSANLSVADVTMVSMPITETDTAYTKGIVDAVVTYEPYSTRIQNSGGKLLFDSTQMPGEITDVLVVHNDIIEQSATTLQNLVDSQFEALTYLNEHTESAAEIMAQRENVSPDQFKELLTKLTLPDRDTNRQLLSSEDDTLPRAIQKLAKVMLEQDILRSDVSGREYRDNRFVK